MPRKTSIYAALLILVTILASHVFAQKRSQADIEAKINALIAKMTLAEKLGQLQQMPGAGEVASPETIEMAKKGLVGSTLGVRGAKNVNELQRAAMQSRLKIPVLLGFDVIHGYRTIFPIPLAQAASWDPQMVERDSAIAAVEARSVGLHWTFAPMVDIARDPRWGRIMEGAGEDTYLGSLMAAAQVRGFQGDDYGRPDKILACAKHFAGYGAAEAGREYNTVDMSERTLRDTYLVPFKAAKDAGVGSFMASFNDLNGVPSTGNPFLLRKILRDEWKFDGLVVSDYNSVRELINHGLAADQSEAAMYGLNGGTDLEMVSRTYNQYGEELVKNGKVSIKTIDDAVRNVLRVKFRLGLFEHPYVDENLESATLKKPEFMQAAKDAAIRSFVLLKNDNDTLPISKNVKRVAVVGALAADKANTLDWWAGDGKAEDSVTILEGLREKIGADKVRFEKGCELVCDTDKDFNKAVDAAKDSDFTILVVGEIRDISGEAGSRSDIGLPGRQLDLVKAIHATGKPYAVVLKNGRPLTIPWLAENSPAILETWHSGTMGGPAVADVLFGDANPSGKLPATFPRSVGQIPLYYNHKSTGRPANPNDRYTSKYTDIPNTPLYPFGYGLSYTKFAITDLRLDSQAIPPQGSVKASVQVENVGKRTGAEVVQLYIQDVAASITRPVRELKGFQKITLNPGEKRRVEFTLTPKELGFYNVDRKFIVEPGLFRVFVGDSSDATLQAEFNVEVTATRKALVPVKPSVSGNRATQAKPVAVLSPQDDALLEDLEKRTFQFFWEQSDPNTGLTLDRSKTDGTPPQSGDDHYRIASIASTGFALSGLCIAADRGWVPRQQAIERTRNTLRFFAVRAVHKNGWFYHWMDAVTGERRWNSEISSIDTALLLGGVLTVKGCFSDDRAIGRLADQIYRRVDFIWMLNGDPYLLSHGWRPENGWIPNRWHDYSEDMILYLLAIGSSTHPIPAEAWYKWERGWITYGKYKYLAAVPPLFIHQFSHAWVDFRGLKEAREPYVDYYKNSVDATNAQRQFFIDVLSKEFPQYSASMWGLTASDSEKGYLAWGAPPRDPNIDGTVVPCAPAGSLMFTPEISLAALREMKSRFGDKIYGRYGFTDAFNPHDGWINPDVIGIDLGITLLSAENARSGKVWYWFMKSPETQAAMKLVELRKY